MFRTCIMKAGMLLLFTCTLFAAGGREKSEPLTELNVSYVKSPFNLQVMVMKDQGMLEEAFAKDGIAVRWHEINSGAKQAEAMAAGSLDIASVINTASVIIANAAGNEIDIIDIVSRPVETFAIMVMDDGPLGISDLAGKTVAGPKGTVLHQLLEAVKKKEQLQNVSLISMGLPQAQAALISGDIDAALLAASLIIKTQEAGGRILTTSEGYVRPLLVGAARQGFAEAHPEAVRKYNNAHKMAYSFIMEHPEKALAIGAREQGISLEDARFLYESSGIANGFTPADRETLEEDAAFLMDLDMIETPVNIDGLFARNLR
ncbi:MAG: NrtA/SsuA/CpmA family ABC transporter substrate-binding protein [Spirochaetales bacterium]|nr:NrtA/SsuA/CpmA family ABC transporter substrate-binding protein [Spirochaetales bacterium]